MGPRIVALLLSPRQLSLRNAILRGERRGLYLGLASLGLLFWLGLFGTVYFLIDAALRELAIMAPFLTEAAQQMLLGGLFILLTYSNIITALSTYYLSDDLELVLSLPVRRTEFHYARYVDTMVQSSWMMGLFGVPVFLAYGIRSEAGPAFYAALVFGLPLFLTLSTSIGVTVATVLVNVFSARRTRDLMVILGLLMIVVLFVYVRTLQPERLVNTEEFENLAEYLIAIDVPAPLLFPPRWMNEILTATLTYRPTPWREIALLVSGAGAAAAIARWTVLWGFDRGWAGAQEAKAARFYRSPMFDRIARFTPASWRPIFAKEMRVFLRDPAQWSQIFLLMGICAIYLVTAYTLPVGNMPAGTAYWVKQLFSFMNLGMGGFIMAAVAGRFQYTAVSREGRSWWITRSAPVNPSTWLWAKSAMGFLPMVLVGEVVIVGSGLVLEVQPALLVTEALTGLLLAFGISGMAMSMGALWPDFKADTAARAATSPGAVFFMVVAQVLVFLVLALEVLGVYLAMRGWPGPAAVCGVVIVLLCLVAGIWPMRRAAESLWAQGL